MDVQQNRPAANSVGQQATAPHNNSDGMVTAWYEAILQNMSDGLIVADTSGRIVDMNPAALAMFGFGSKEDMVQAMSGNAKVMDITGPDGKELSVGQWPFTRASSGERFTGQEYSVYIRPTKRRWYAGFSGAPVLNKNGAIECTVLTIRDISEKKQAEWAEQAARELAEHKMNEALEMQHRLDAVMQALPVGVALLDTQGGTISANRAFDEIWGNPRPAATTIGDYIQDKASWADTGKTVLPDEWASSRALRNGETVTSQIIRIVGFDGVQRVVLDSAAPILDTFGEVAGCAVTIQDITRQMENERAVRESEQRFKSLYLSMSEGLANHEIVYADEKAADYVITDANPAFERITGLDRTSSVGKKASILYGTGSPPFLDIYARVAESGVPEYFETPFPPMKKHFAISVFSPGKGKFATVFTDITERKRAEEAMAAELAATSLLQKISARFVRAGEFEDALGEIVDAAIAVTHADMGNIQLLQPESGCLKIAAYRGFEEPFLNFWNAVAEGQGNCGTAMKKAERSIVEDLTQSDIFVGTPSLKVQLDADVRAVQSTPLISHSGTLIGMLSTHWRVPHRPQQRELDLLDLLVQEAVDIIELARAEDALRESEERFKAISETTPVGIGVVGLPEATFLYVNPAYVKSFGYTESEILGKGVQDIYWSIEDRDRVLGILKKEGSVAEYEVKLKRKDGAPFWGLSSARPITYGGRPALLGAFVDITERKRAEKEIVRDEARLESLLRISQIRVDSIQALLDFALNEAIALTESKIGYIYHYNDTRKEFTLNTWSKEVMEQCAITEKQSVYQLEKTGIWGEAVRQGKPIIINDFHAPHPLKKGYPEGHAPLYRFMTIPILSEGRIIGVVGVANKETDYNNTDVRQLTLLMDSAWKITERKKAEDALKISELRYRRLFEAAKDGILILDFETGMIVDVNKFLIDWIGYSFEDLLDKHLWDVGIFKDVVASKDAFRELQKKEFIRYENLPLETKSGKKMAVEFVSNVYLVDNKKVIQCNIRDITERKHAEDEVKRHATELKAANEDLVRFNSAMVDRELRMIELKKQVNELCGKMGMEPVYKVGIGK